MIQAAKPKPKRETGCKTRSAIRALRRFGCVMLGLVLMMSALMSDASAQNVANKEYMVKLAYIYKFTRYVKWPDAAGAKSRPFVIGVLGEDPFGSSLDRLEKRAVGGCPIVVRRLKTPDQVVGTHVLFVGKTVPLEQVQRLLQGEAANSSRLIVCESPGMAAAGATVNFFMDDNRTIGFEMNVDALRRSGLQPDAQILGIARVVRDGRPGL